MTPDDQIQAARPTAAALSHAVDREDRVEVARLLLPLDVEQLRALAIVLAAHCDVPIEDHTGKRPKEDYDAAVVERILAGDMALARYATEAERITVWSLWVAKTGRPITDLEKSSGWNFKRLREASQDAQEAA